MKKIHDWSIIDGNSVELNYTEEDRFEMVLTATYDNEKNGYSVVLDGELLETMETFVNEPIILNSIADVLDYWVSMLSMVRVLIKSDEDLTVNMSIALKNSKDESIVYTKNVSFNGFDEIVKMVEAN